MGVGAGHEASVQVHQGTTDAKVQLHPGQEPWGCLARLVALVGEAQGGGQFLKDLLQVSGEDAEVLERYATRAVHLSAGHETQREGF